MTSQAHTSAPDPIARRSDGSYPDVGQAFTGMLAVLDEIVFNLGGTQAARAVVSCMARNAFSELDRRTYSWQTGLGTLGRHLAFCGPLVATTDGFRYATQYLKDACRVRSELPVAFIGKFEGGDLTIRGDRMFFETETASFMLGHCYMDDLYRARKEGDERWTTAVTKEAEILLDLSSLKQPSVCMTHSKSRAAAIKGLVRVAADWFKVDLKPMDSLRSSSE